MDVRLVEAANPSVIVYTESVGPEPDTKRSRCSWNGQTLGVVTSMSQL